MALPDVNTERNEKEDPRKVPPQRLGFQGTRREAGHKTSTFGFRLVLSSAAVSYHYNCVYVEQ